MTSAIHRIATAHLQRQAGLEIGLSELPEDRKEIVKLFRKRRLSLRQVWDGLHGYILDFAGRGVLDFTIVSELINYHPFRWVSIDTSSAFKNLPQGPRGPVIGGNAGADTWRMTESEIFRWMNEDRNRKLPFKELSIGC